MLVLSLIIQYDRKSIFIEGLYICNPEFKTFSHIDRMVCILPNVGMKCKNIKFESLENCVITTLIKL